MKKRITSSKSEAKRVDTLTKSAKAKALAAKAAENDAAKAAEASAPPQVNVKTFDFPINTKFIMMNVLYTVIKTHKDSNTEWRTVISAVHQDQDFMLTTLRKDALSDPNFVVVEVGNGGRAYL